MIAIASSPYDARAPWHAMNQYVLALIITWVAKQVPTQPTEMCRYISTNNLPGQ